MTLFLSTIIILGSVSQGEALFSRIASIDKCSKICFDRSDDTKFELCWNCLAATPLSYDACEFACGAELTDDVNHYTLEKLCDRCITTRMRKMTNICRENCGADQDASSRLCTNCVIMRQYYCQHRTISMC